MVGLRSSLPLAGVLGLYTVVVPNVISFLQSSTNVALSIVVTAIAAWWTFGLLGYLYRSTTLRFAGPVPLPIVGNCLSLKRKGNLQESIRALVATYGKEIDLLVLNGKRMVLVNDAAVCRTICKSTDRGDLSLSNTLDWEKKWREHFLTIQVGANHDLPLFARTSDILDWTSHRKFLQPAFDQKHVRAMAVKIEVAVQTMLEGLEPGKVIDMLMVFQDFGLEMIHLTSFGPSATSLPDRGRFLVDILNTQMKLYSSYQFDPFLFITAKVLPEIGLNPAEIQRRKNVPILRNYCRGLLKTELERQKKEGVADGGVDNLVSIMASGISEKFGEENLIDELISFIIAGYDTTSVTLGNLVHHLATHPTIQEKLYDEISSVLGHGQVGLADAVNDMPYLAACIRESQRLQPVAPLLQRRTQQDIPIKPSDGSESVIPKGTIALIPCFLLHRDEKQYPDPESFLPERWLDESDKLIPPKAGYYYAFGSGPKMCIGIQLAEREVKMAAAGVLNEFRAESRGGVKIVDTFTTGPVKVLVELSRRN